MPNWSFEQRIPPGDDRPRSVCTGCGFVDYQNPKIIVGTVVRFGDGVLLCRRAIEPRLGYWTIPAGYMELGETAEQGAKREAAEEACADVQIESLLAVYSIPSASQVQLIFRGTLAEPAFAAGAESLEVELVRWNNIPWQQLAFPSVVWALRHDRSIVEEGAAPPFSAPTSLWGHDLENWPPVG